MFYWRWLNNLATGPVTTGYPTKPDPDIAASHDISVGTRWSDADPIRRSLAIRHLDAGSCNGCESELQLLAGPDYDFTRYGFHYVPSPRHADILVVTGIVTEPMREIIRSVFAEMPGPKSVVALGDCPLMGVDRGAGLPGRLDGVVPVRARVSGCPPTPADVLRALLWVVDGRDPQREDGL